MRPDPVVSVIIPAYQAEQTLGAAITSALTQTYPHTEIVICDDGSTDATAAIAAAYGARVRLLRQGNAGVAAARNNALSAATGQLCALLDADDFWFPQYLSSAVAMWQEQGGGRSMVTATAYFLTDDGIAPQRRVITEAVPVERQRARALESPIVTGFAVFPKAMYDELGGFDTTLRTAEDYDFWLRAILAGWKVLYQMVPQAIYRRAGGTLSTALEQLQRDEETIFSRLIANPDVVLTSAERDQISDRLRLGAPQAHIGRGESALRDGDPQAAARHFAVASGLLPSNRGLRRKAALLKAPLTGRLLAQAQARRHRET